MFEDEHRDPWDRERESIETLFRVVMVIAVIVAMLILGDGIWGNDGVEPPPPVLWSAFINIFRNLFT